MESKLYVLCSDKLDPVYACVQGGHAVAEYMIDNHVELHDWISDKNLKNCWTNNTIVYVYCDIKELIHLLSKECYIPFSEWREPDYNNEITAIAIWNQDIANRSRCSKHIQEYIDKLEIIKAGS